MNTVTINDAHFGTSPTLGFSPDGGYSYSLGGHTDSQITAYITPPISASGTVTVTVTSNGYNGYGFFGAPGQSGGTSSGATATIQVPAKSNIYQNTKSTYSNQTYTSCDGSTSTPNMYGYQHCIYYQIEDSDSNPIYATYTVNESFNVIAQNITVSMSTGGHESNSTGDFGDELHLISSSPLPSNACSVLKQTFTITGVSQPIRVNCLQFSQNDVSITDVTTNPSQCSSTNYSCP